MSHLIRVLVILILSVSLQGCGKRPHEYSGGFAAGGMFARFDSKTPRDPVYVIYAQTEPARTFGLKGSMGGDIYGGGYFTIEDGPTIRFSMPDSETVMIGSHAARLTEGRFLKVFILPSGDLRFEQESLDTPLAQTVLNTL